jgi:hypothetical protein
MLLSPGTADVIPPGLDELIANLHDPSWGEALGGGRPNGARRS